jgi:hypothetical protein
MIYVKQQNIENAIWALASKEMNGSYSLEGTMEKAY